MNWDVLVIRYAASTFNKMNSLIKLSLNKQFYKHKKGAGFKVFVIIFLTLIIGAFFLWMVVSMMRKFT